MKIALKQWNSAQNDEQSTKMLTEWNIYEWMCAHMRIDIVALYLMWFW